MNASDKQAELRLRIKSFRKINSVNFNPVRPINVKGILQGIIFFLPAIYLVVYTIGFMKYFGHVDTYGINTVEFPIPVDTTLLWGVLALLPGLKYWLIIPLLFTSYVILIIIALFANKPRLSIIQWASKKISNLPKPQKKSKGDIILVKGMVAQADASMTFTMQSFLCFLIIFFPILIGYISMKQGISEAQQNQKDFLHQKKYNLNFSAALSNGPYMRVACNTTHCAFWNNDGTILLRHEQVDKVVIITNE